MYTLDADRIDIIELLLNHELLLNNAQGSTPQPYHSVLAVQMKNWEPLVLAPEFAIDKIPERTQY